MLSLLDIFKRMREYIINKVYELRKELDVRQEDLANAVGVTRQTIIAIERGNYTPSLLLAMQIAGYFKVEIEDIFELQ